MDKKIVERLVNMGLIAFVGVDCDKFKTVDDLIDSGLITATIDRAKLYEIIGEPTPVVEETPTDTEVDVKEIVVGEVVIEEVNEVDVPADAEIVDEVVIEEVDTPAVEVEVVEEKTTTVETPKKKSNKKTE
jgi:hypothetical protein